MRESNSQFFICAKEIDVGKRKRTKKPVLTSPWKIGTMVALMLIGTSFGVGYYMVSVYDIDLYWLSSDVSKWVVDSYQFFKEIYPAAAGVVLLSLFTYFVIASAVRRYKYYLNSGQDYRKMISLADSIDDLTNPAQIARLSEYPELQGVLRNYGDQIHEISEGMENCEEEMRSVDLEVEIESILEGKGMNETLADGKWWASIARKIQAWSVENADGTKNLRKQSEAARQAAGMASLSCGKVIETVAGASENILDIVRSVGELNVVAEGLGTGAAAESGSPSDAIAAIEIAASALEERGSLIHELSEESNGLALNIALMAARGEATEQDLAQLAEKVRSTAERFGKLGRELESLARTVADNSRNAKSTSCVSAAAGAGPGTAGGIIEISEKIESFSRALQQKMTVLGSDVEEISKALKSGHKESGDAVISGDGDDRIRATDGSIVNFGAGSNESVKEPCGIDDSNLVIDHGKLWGDSDSTPGNGMESGNDAAAPDDDVAEENVSDDSGELLISGFREATSAIKPDTQEQAQNDGPAEEPVVEQVKEKPSLYAEEIVEEAGEHVQPEVTVEETVEHVHVEKTADVVDELFAGNPAANENWDDMQGQVNKQVEVEIKPETKNEPADELPAVEPEIVPEPAAPASAVSMDETMPETGEEPVYDLFELGAVEYVKETEVNL